MSEIRVVGVIGDPENGITAKQFVEQLQAFNGEDVSVYITSEGGSAMQGFAMGNALRKYPGKVTTIIEGGAFSIAGYIATCGDERIIEPNSMLHRHGPISETKGFLEDHEDSIAELKRVRSAMLDHYANISNDPREDIDANLSRDVFMDADEAVARGYMTQIGEENKVAARIDDSLKQKLPRRFAAMLHERTEDKPDGGVEMPTTKTKPATVKELKAAFKGASAEFIVDQLDGEATMETATAAYIETLEGQVNKFAKAEAKAMEDEVEVIKEETTPMAMEDVIAAAVSEAVSKALGMDPEHTEAMEDEEYSEAMEEEATAKLATAQARIEKLEAQLERKNRRTVGATAKRTSTRSPRQVAKTTAKAELNNRVKALIDENPKLERHVAKQRVFKDDPKLRERLVAEAN